MKIGGWSFKTCPLLYLQDVGVICLVERLCGLRIATGDILQELEKNVQSRVGDVAHGVFKGPNDGVQHQLELGGRN